MITNHCIALPRRLFLGFPPVSLVAACDLHRLTNPALVCYTDSIMMSQILVADQPTSSYYYYQPALREGRLVGVPKTTLRVRGT
jgi:hypothetical protein